MQSLAASLARVLAPISRAALWLSAVGLVMMTVFVFWQVIGRKVLNDSPSWTEPGSLLLMSWFILLGGAVGLRENDHMGFDVGLIMAPKPLRLAMRIVTHVLIIIFGIYMAIYGWQLTEATWSAKMPGINIPQGMDYLPLVGGGILFALFAFEKLVNLFVAHDMSVTQGHGPVTSSVE